MINISIHVNEDGVKYFHHKLKKKTDLLISIKNAYYLSEKIAGLWKKESVSVISLINQIFNDIDINIKLEVYPEYFFLGAINTELGIIVLGQPSRSSSFYLGIILHEIIHFILKNRNINRFVEEVICFLFERMFILKLDGIDINDFEYEKTTDDFHKHAIFYSKYCYKDFLRFYEKRDINGFILFLNQTIDDKKKQINVENNLIDYILNNG